MQNRNCFSHHHGQIQLHGSLDFLLLARGDIFSNGLRCALYGFGGHLQIGKQFHLLLPMFKRSLLAHHGLHAADSRRGLGVFDVQFDVGGELTDMAVRAQVVGARYFYGAHGGQNRLGT